MKKWLKMLFTKNTTNPSSEPIKENCNIFKTRESSQQKTYLCNFVDCHNKPWFLRANISDTVSDTPNVKLYYCELQGVGCDPVYNHSSFYYAAVEINEFQNLEACDYWVNTEFVKLLHKQIQIQNLQIVQCLTGFLVYFPRGKESELFKTKLEAKYNLEQWIKDNPKYMYSCKITPDKNNKVYIVNKLSRVPAYTSLDDDNKKFNYRTIWDLLRYDFFKGNGKDKYISSLTAPIYHHD